MKTFDELVDEHLAPVTEALRAFSASDNRHHQHALEQFETTVTRAEDFAARHAHVDTQSARDLRDTVRSMRRIFDYHHAHAHALPVLASESAHPPVPSAPQRSPQPYPPAHALVLTREQLNNPQEYARAKAQAAREGKEIWSA